MRHIRWRHILRAEESGTTLEEEEEGTLRTGGAEMQTNSGMTCWIKRTAKEREREGWMNGWGGDKSYRTTAKCGHAAEAERERL